MWDVIIVGAGSAGLTAAMYCRRKNLSTMILSIDVGGQTNMTSRIENYPGVDPCHGAELMRKFRAQAEGAGAEIRMGKLASVEKGGSFMLTCAAGEKYESRSVILAFGKVPRTLGVEGEAKFFGKGVSTCVTCDGPLYRGKTVAVVGGGNSAAEAALELSNIAKKVYVLHRRDSLRADEVLVEKLKEAGNVEFLWNSEVEKFIGDEKLRSIMVCGKEIGVDGVFLEVGWITDVSAVDGLVKVNENKEIVIDDRCRTSCEGVFASGDVTSVPFKQTVISAGEGAKAALQCYAFLAGKPLAIDWTH